MVIIYLGILTVSCFRFSKFPLNFYLKNKVIFFFAVGSFLSLSLCVSLSLSLIPSWDSKPGILYTPVLW